MALRTILQHSARAALYYTVLIILINQTEFAFSTNRIVEKEMDSSTSNGNSSVPSEDETKFTVINSTTVQISMHSRFVKRQEHMLLEIRYRMALEYVLYSEFKDNTTTCGKIASLMKRSGTVKIQMNNTLDLEVCKKSINMFGSYNDSSDTTYHHLFKYCNIQKVYINFMNETSTLINDLLPAKLYEFYWRMVGPDLEPMDSADPDFHQYAFCTFNDKPLYPPQTDIGSFITIVPSETEINNISRKNFEQTRKIELYYRPVPKVFMNWDSDLMTYEIICRDVKGMHLYYTYNTTHNHKVGKVIPNLPFYQDTTYICEIRSKNLYGYSRSSSIITIPEQNRVIDTRGKFIVYSVRNEEIYQLRWTNMSKLLSNSTILHNKAGNFSSQQVDGVYTVFWCETSAKSTKGCEVIDGMKKSTSTAMTLKIPRDLEPAFGVAFRSDKNRIYTGIIWSTCLGKPYQGYEPLEITHFSGSEHYIEIAWTIPHCISNTILFKNYTLEYCPLKPVDPCQTETDKSLKGDSIHFEGRKGCARVTIANDLTNTRARILNLEDSTIYIVRARAQITLNVSNKWSDILVISTSNMKSCFWYTYSSLVLTLLIPTTLALVIIIKRKMVISFYNEIQLLLEARASMPKRIEEILNKEDTISEIEMKYWVDHTPENASLNDYPYYCESEKGLTLGTNSYQATGKEEKSFSVPDYIDPIYLINGHARISNQDSLNEYSRNSGKFSSDEESVGESEISIASQSSYINNLLREDDSTQP